MFQSPFVISGLSTFPDPARCKRELAIVRKPTSRSYPQGSASAKRHAAAWVASRHSGEYSGYEGNTARQELRFAP